MKPSYKPELLMPAGSLPVLKVAVMYGADAVYIGGEAFSLRAKAHNFSIEDMKEGIAFAHERGVKVYVTANILAHNADLAEAEDYFKEIKGIGVDALIISDPGIFQVARKVLPEVDVHISTQANNTNAGTYNFWHDLGATRVVSARELSLEEIAQIKRSIPAGMEIETFIHGAMCISYSGRCLLSAFMTGRSANLGECTHPCRWKYALMEESRPGQYMPVMENERGTYIFNSRDLCMIEHIPEMVEAGIDSFKVEGRMKSALYVASVCRTYRMAIDDWFEDPEKYRSRLEFYKGEISKCTYREYTTGFFFGKPDENAQIYDANTYVKEWVYLGMINGDTRIAGMKGSLGGQKGQANQDIATIAGADSADKAGVSTEINSGINTGIARTVYGLEQKNKFSVGETVEIMKPSGENVQAQVLGMWDEDGSPIESCPHPRQHFYVDFGVELQDYDIIRRNSACILT